MPIRRTRCAIPSQKPACETSSIKIRTGIQGPPGPPGRDGAMVQRFEFPEPALEWRVFHGRGTEPMMWRVNDDGGRTINAQVDMDDNVLVVKLTSATAGYVDALFNVM